MPLWPGMAFLLQMLVAIYSVPLQCSAALQCNCGRAKCTQMVVRLAIFLECTFATKLGCTTFTTARDLEATM